MKKKILLSFMSVCISVFAFGALNVSAYRYDKVYYQMKLEAMKHQGKALDTTCAQIGHKLKSKDILAEQVGESRNQIQRYIRLTNLIDPILDMVDNNQIAMNAAVEISYLGSKEQAAVMQSIEKEETSPSNVIDTDVSDAEVPQQKREYAMAR